MNGFSSSAYRELGSTGLRVSPIGLGTVKFGRNTDVKYPDAFELPDDAAVSKILDTARALGINLLDTAPAYGTAEERLGRLLGNREEWILSTKVGESYVDGRSTFDFTREATERSIERSLGRLGTEWLDIVLVHSDGNDEAVIGQTDVLETLQRLQQQGKIRAIGVSTKTITGGLLAVEIADLVMVAYNETDQSQQPVLDRAAATGRGVLVKKALASGHSTSPAEALRFVLGQPAVTSAVIGTINPSHLEANVSSVL